MQRFKTLISLSLTILLIIGSISCFTRMMEPYELTSILPTPILDNSGLYMCPYTQDQVLAEWTDKAINAKTGAEIGGAVGTIAGQKLAEKIPFIGGFLGEKVGNSAGRAIAIKASGGMEYIKSTSDVSFNSLEDLSLFMYIKFSNNEHYQDALDAVQAIYPKMKKVYFKSIMKASKKVKKS